MAAHKTFLRVFAFLRSSCGVCVYFASGHMVLTMGKKIHDYEMTCIFKLSSQATLNTEAVQPQPRNKKVFDIPK